MMPSDLGFWVHNALDGKLGKLGFKSLGYLSFARCSETCIQLVNVGGRTEGREYKFTCMLGIRFDEIERILRPSVADKSYPTVSCPIHFLRPEREYYELKGSCIDELSAATNSLIEELNEVGLTFFERFATIEAIADDLSGSPVSDFFVLSPHQKVGILAAISLIKGKRLAAEQIISDALNDPMNRSPAIKRRIEEVHEQLLAKESDHHSRRNLS